MPGVQDWLDTMANREVVRDHGGSALAEAEEGGSGTAKRETTASRVSPDGLVNLVNHGRCRRFVPVELTGKQELERSGLRILTQLKSYSSPFSPDE